MGLLGILGFIIFGLIVGAIAKFIMPGRDPGGFFVTAILGMVGSLAGGLIGQYVLGRGENYTPGWIMSIVGAIVLLAIYRFFTSSGRGSRSV
jgi:uncharacterized membrane protein YeaQ/YmgE (transglycosylase-associated protein family)